MICKHCGYANGTEAKYCARCGKKLNRESKPEKKEMAIFATLFLLIGIFAGMGISGYFRNENRTVGHKSEIAQVLPMEDGSVAVLYGNGRVEVAGNPGFSQKVSTWERVTQLYYDRASAICDYEPMLAGVTEDGGVITTAEDFSYWKDVKALRFNYQGMVGITNDGSVLAYGLGAEIAGLSYLTNVEDLIYSDILETWGCLKKDGTVRLISEYTDPDMVYWNDVQELRTSGHSFYVIKKDGTIDGGMEETYSGLHGAVKIVDFEDWIFGIAADGKLLTHDGGNIYTNTGDMMVGRSAAGPYSGEVYISQFDQIRDIVPYYGLILLNEDGTVDSIGAYPDWDLSAWDNIKTVCGDWENATLYGIREDGSVIVNRYDMEDDTQTITDQYRGWRLQNIYPGLGGVVGLTKDGMLVGNGIYENTDFSGLNS